MDIILMGLRLIINQSILDDFISPIEQQKSNYSIRVQSFAQLYLYVPLHQKKISCNSQRSKNCVDKSEVCGKCSRHSGIL
jgi:hypothetical protein